MNILIQKSELKDLGFAFSTRQNCMQLQRKKVVELGIFFCTDFIIFQLNFQNEKKEKNNI